MRFGIIDRSQVSGNQLEVFVRVDGDIEGPCPVATFVGAKPDIEAGAPCALFALEGPSGEYAAVPMRWLNVGEVAKLVALFEDVENIKAGLVGHGHLSGTAGTITGGPLSLSPPNDPINPTITGANRFKVTHG